MDGDGEAGAGEGGPMINIVNRETGQILGAITEEELQFLVDELEEESDTDRDYYLDSPTIDMLEQDGADPGLVALLRKALGEQEGIEIAWSRS